MAANEKEERGWILPLRNTPFAAVIIEVLGTVHQLLLSLEEEAQSQ